MSESNDILLRKTNSKDSSYPSANEDNDGKYQTAKPIVSFEKMVNNTKKDKR